MLRLNSKQMTQIKQITTDIVKKTKRSKLIVGIFAN